MDFLIIVLCILVALLFIALILQIIFPDEKSARAKAKAIKKIRHPSRIKRLEDWKHLNS